MEDVFKYWYPESLRTPKTNSHISTMNDLDRKSLYVPESNTASLVLTKDFAEVEACVMAYYAGIHKDPETTSGLAPEDAKGTEAKPLFRRGDRVIVTSGMARGTFGTIRGETSSLECFLVALDENPYPGDLGPFSDYFEVEKLLKIPVSNGFEHCVVIDLENNTYWTIFGRRPDRGYLIVAGLDSRVVSDQDMLERFEVMTRFEKGDEVLSTSHGTTGRVKDIKVRHAQVYLQNQVFDCEIFKTLLRKRAPKAFKTKTRRFEVSNAPKDDYSVVVCDHNGDFMRLLLSSDEASRVCLAQDRGLKVSYILGKFYVSDPRDENKDQMRPLMEWVKEYKALEAVESLKLSYDHPYSKRREGFIPYHISDGFPDLTQSSAPKPPRTTYGADIVLASGERVTMPDPDPEHWELVKTNRFETPGAVPISIYQDCIKPRWVLKIDSFLTGECEILHDEAKCWLHDMSGIVSQLKYIDAFETRFSYVTEIRTWQERNKAPERYTDSILTALW